MALPSYSQAEELFFDMESEEEDAADFERTIEGLANTATTLRSKIRALQQENRELRLALLQENRELKSAVQEANEKIARLEALILAQRPIPPAGLTVQGRDEDAFWTTAIAATGALTDEDSLELSVSPFCRYPAMAAFHRALRMHPAGLQLDAVAFHKGELKLKVAGVKWEELVFCLAELPHLNFWLQAADEQHVEVRIQEELLPLTLQERWERIRQKRQRVSPGVGSATSDLIQNPSMTTTAASLANLRRVLESC